MSIYEKLQKIQKLLVVPKDQKNKTMGYSYRNVESIFAMAKPLCEEVGIFLSISDRIERIDERCIYVFAVATAVDMETGEKWSVEGAARDALEKKGTNDAAQITGAASSYARKRALCGLFLIDDEVDVDSIESDAQGNNINNNITVDTQKRNNLISQLQTLCTGVGVDVNYFCQTIAKKNVLDMPYEWLEKAVSKFPETYIKFQEQMAQK